MADPADVDRGHETGLPTTPWAPWQLIDLIGLDIHRAKMQTLRRVLDDPRYKHPPLVDEMIANGRQTGYANAGKGFYDYGD